MRSAYGGKTGFPGNDYVIVAARTVDNLDIAAFIPAAYDANVGITRIENQVAGLGLSPSDRGAVGMLCMSAPAMAQDVTAA